MESNRIIGAFCINDVSMLEYHLNFLFRVLRMRFQKKDVSKQLGNGFPARRQKPLCLQGKTRRNSATDTPLNDKRK